jgi:hypothetical protein
MMAVDVKTGAGVETSVPRVLFETRVRSYPLYDLYGVTGDGQKFLAVETVKEAPTPIRVTLDWPALLPRRR